MNQNVELCSARLTCMISAQKLESTIFDNINNSCCDVLLLSLVLLCNPCTEFLSFTNTFIQNINKGP